MLKEHTSRANEKFRGAVEFLPVDIISIFSIEISSCLEKVEKKEMLFEKYKRGKYLSEFDKFCFN